MMELETAPAADTVTELRALAKAADAWRKDRGMTDEQFCARFGKLCGDRKTLSQLARSEPDRWDRNPELWLQPYRDLARSLRECDQVREEMPILTLPKVVEFTTALKAMRTRRDEKRVLWVEGRKGTGKSTLLRSLRAHMGERRCIIIRGRQSWSSFSSMLKDWLRALGGEVKESRRPESASRLQERVSERLLSTGDMVLGIDEAHCIPGAGLNFLRDVVNDAQEADTRVHFVGAAIPSVWDTLTARYKDEAEQLIRRFSDRISLDEYSEADCLQLFTQRVDLSHLDGAAAKVGALLATNARHSGSLSFVADVAEHAAAKGRALTLSVFEDIIASTVRKNRCRS